MAEIYSMTGFGAAAAERDGARVRIEIKTVNNRGLKINIRSRPSLGMGEKIIRDRLNQVLARGSVEVFVFYERPIAGSGIIRLENARGIVESLRRLASELDLPDNLTARDLPLIPGIFDNSAEDPLEESEITLVEEALALALAQVQQMRLTEGEKLAAILTALTEPLVEFVTRTRAAAPLAMERSKQRLQERLEDLRPQGLSNFDSQALERELCLIAEKADIHEELDRLESHLGQYRDTLSRGGEMGKRLDFLAQEFLREINTTASKSNATEIIQWAVQAKLTVEKIKEQAANLA
ncbi:MAG: YicC family protein [Planctomycetota bacterium]|jgi:uncharacterized protein (TIGR00255 family)|nr:YicC family protein [Planctomycetota bacterium]